MLKYLNPLNQKKPGVATLAAVTIVMFTSLLVGLAVSQRAGSGIRRSTYTGQTDQAFSCATSGVEDALLCVTNEEKAGGDPTSCSASNTPLSSCSYSYTVSNLVDTTLTIDLLEKDTVQQFNVSGDSTVNVTWGVNSSGGEKPGIEISYIYKNGTDYEMKKSAYICNGITSTSDHSPSPTGFSSSTAISEKCSETITLGAANSPAVLRIRPFFSDISLSTSGLSGSNSQGYKIASQGTAGTVTRNIEVLRMNPQLPAIFDYVLYSEDGSITK